MKELLKEVFPFWNDIKESDRETLSNSSFFEKKTKGTIMYNNQSDCDGVIVVKKGRIRVYITSPNGNEITLFRIFDRDLCMLSASCIINNLSFDSEMLFEEDSEILIIPMKVYKDISDRYAEVKNYTLEIISGKFSDAIWVFSQFVFSNMASRLAATLLEYRAFEGSDTLNVTHEMIAKDLGTAREVVTRMLKQFQLDEVVKLSRGKIEILRPDKLSDY